jgi:hypothetical protein
MIVSETVIDAIVEELENSDFEKEVADFSKKQPVLISYIFSEDFELLTQDEREYMLYLLLVIFKSIEKTNPKLPPLSKNALEIAEERNWELMETVTANHFRDRLDVFFKTSNQEDLLAFVEDALVEDEDSNITKEGREPIFIALKTVIDVLT